MRGFRLFLSIAILFFSGSFLYAQPGVKIQQLNSCENESLLVGVEASSQITGMNVLELHIGINPELVSFNEGLITNLAPAMQGVAPVVNYSPQLNKLIFIWLNLTPVNIASGTKLFDLKLHYTGGHANLEILPMSYIAINYSPVPANFQSGGVWPLIDVISQPSDQIVEPGADVVFSVGLADALIYTFQWQESLGLEWTDLIDNEQYSGVTEASLSIADVDASFQGRRYRCLISLDDCTISTRVAELFISGQPDWYQLILDAQPAEGGTLSDSEGYYPEGFLVEDVSAFPAEGYRFIHWKDQNEQTVSIDPVFDFVMPSAATLLTAYFEIKQYSINLDVFPSDAGMIQRLVPEEDGPWNHGSEIVLQAVSLTGYAFTGWYEEMVLVSENAVYSFELVSDRNLQARFEPLEIFSLELSAEPEGAGLLLGSGNYFQGQEVTVSAAANYGFEFLHWKEGDLVLGNDAEYTFIMDRNLHLVAVFNPLSFEISASVFPEEAGQVEGTGLFPFGSLQSLTAIAAEGYVFEAWYEEDEWLSDDNPFFFTLEADRHIQARFIQLPVYDLTLVSEPEGAGELEGAGSYFEGSQVTVSAQANFGYEFVNWSEDQEVLSQDASFSFVINRSLALTAAFEALLFEISATAAPAEGGEITGAGSYAYATSVELTAIPATGYHFVNWLENGEELSTSAVLEAEVTGNRHFVAVFALNEYSLELVPDPEGSGQATIVEPATGGPYTHGTSISLLATPDEGFAFAGWFENGQLLSNEAEFSFVILDNMTITALFEALDEFQLMLTSEPEDAGELSGAGTYFDGQLVEISAEANFGYAFLHWVEDGEILSELPQYSFVITDDRFLTAVFVPLMFDITVDVIPAQGGEVSGTGSFAYNTLQTLEATAGEGYFFVGWFAGGQLLSAEHSYSFVLAGNIHLQAKFQLLDTFVVSLDATPAGAGELSGADTYFDGQLVEISAEANFGYAFLHWVEDGEIVSEQAQFSFTITADRSFTAVFEPLMFEIAIDVVPPQGGEVSGAGSYAYNTVQTLEATAGHGFYFAGWYMADQLLSTEPQYSILVLDNMTITALFEPLDEFQLVLTSEPEGAGELSGAGTYFDGSLVEISAEANFGYAFSHWAEGGEVISELPQYSFVIDDDRVLTAVFEPLIFDITVDVVPPLGGEVSGAGSYAYNTVQTLEAIASEGYHFTAWIENDDQVGSDELLDVLINGNRHFEAHFSINLYTLDLHVSPEGAGTAEIILPETEGPWPHGTMFDVSASSFDGFAFAGWYHNESLLSAEPQYSFPLLENMLIIAMFEPLEEFQLSLTAEPDGAGELSGAGTYFDGTLVEINAEPTFGYAFVHWAEDGEIISEQPQYSFIITSDRDFTAVFEPLMFEITVDVVPAQGGEVTGAGSYAYNTIQILEATASEGFDFAGWYEDGTLLGSEEQFELLVNGHRHLEAAFTLRVYTLLYEAGENGSISGENPQYVPHGDDGTAVLAVPDAGFMFDKWSDGLEQNPRTDTDVTADLQVTALFMPLFHVQLYVHMHAAAGFTPGSAPVYVTGSMFSWAEPGTEPELQTMSPADEDYVYFRTLDLEGGTYLYKYFIGSGWDNGEWTSGANRELVLVSDTIIHNVFGDITDLSLGVQHPAESHIRVFPNPVSDQFRIESSAVIRELRLFDLNGRLVYQALPMAESWQVQRDGLPSGIYLLQVVTTKGISAERIRFK